MKSEGLNLVACGEAMGTTEHSSSLSSHHREGEAPLTLRFRLVEVRWSLWGRPTLHPLRVPRKVFEEPTTWRLDGLAWLSQSHPLRQLPRIECGVSLETVETTLATEVEVLIEVVEGAVVVRSLAVPRGWRVVVVSLREAVVVPWMLVVRSVAQEEDVSQAHSRSSPTHHSLEGRWEAVREEVSASCPVLSFSFRFRFRSRFFRFRSRFLLVRSPFHPRCYFHRHEEKERDEAEVDSVVREAFSHGSTEVVAASSFLCERSHSSFPLRNEKNMR